MTWLWFAALTAVLESAKDVLGKLRLRASDPVEVAWAWRFYALPFLLPPVLATGWPETDDTFWWALAASGVLNTLTAVLYMKAIKAADLSLTVPMVAFSPLFLLFTSPVILGEMPTSAGMAGVALIVVGSYLLRASQRRQGWLAPVRALWSEAGPRWMLLVALIWSISANIDKIGVLHSSPLAWSLALNAFVALALSPLMITSARRRRLGEQRGHLWLIGGAGGIATLCQMVAITLTLVPYVIAVKRTSTVLSVLWGHLLMGEPGIGERLAGVLVMLAGVLLILLGS